MTAYPLWRSRLGHRPLRTYYLYLITLCSYYKNPVNAGITYIPSADLYYRLVELYSLSTIYSSLNIKNCIVFFNTLIINFHIYTIIYITRKYVMNQTNTHNNNNNIYADSKMPGRLSLVEKYTGHVRTPFADMPRTIGHVRTRTYSYILPIFFNF